MVTFETNHSQSSDPKINPLWYVIESTNIDHIIIWQTESGEIYQSQPGVGSRKVAKNLLDYLEG